MSYPVAVHGGSGTQGKTITDKAVTAGFPVRALTRTGVNVGAAEGTAADFANRGALVSAYAGMRAVVVSLPLVFDPVLAHRHADNVLFALEATSVERAVLLTNGPLAAERTGNGFVDARTQLAEGLPSAVSQAHIVSVSGVYMQNLTAPWSVPLLKQGTAAYPLPREAPVAWLDMNDVADRVVSALTAPQPSEEAVIGPEVLTGTDVSAQLSLHFGPVAWRTITPSEYAEMLRPHLGADAADGISGFYAFPPYAVRQLPLSTGATTLGDYLARER